LAGLIIFSLFLLVIFSKQNVLNVIEKEDLDGNVSKADIDEPKFAINNESKKIYITAMQGYFLNEDEILLEDNVRFTSNDFSIETNRVIFNRNKETAESKDRSLFKTENTTISSDGFDIYDNGNKIIFYGNSFVILK
tara:strand:- start:347 stop:757 length:411 start_codon:yes stop_codon:yes gene_type:complete